jgi:hypothetical protein
MAKCTRYFLSFHRQMLTEGQHISKKACHPGVAGLRQGLASANCVTDWRLVPSGLANRGVALEQSHLDPPNPRKQTRRTMDGFHVCISPQLKGWGSRPIGSRTPNGRSTSTFGQQGLIMEEEVCRSGTLKRTRSRLGAAAYTRSVDLKDWSWLLIRLVL